MVKFKVLAAVAALSIAQPAAAAIIVVTSGGVVSEGFDQTGMFGPAGGDLAGARYSVVEYYDSDSPGAYHDRSSGDGDLIAGGADFGTPSPGGAILTINGVAVSLHGTRFAWLDVYTPASTLSTIVDAAQAGGFETYAELILRFDRPAPLSVLTGWDSDCLAYEKCLGSFEFTYYALPYGPVISSTHGQLAPDYFDAHPAVPEPATWAMMIAGFGLVGSALRRRAAVTA